MTPRFLRCFEAVLGHEGGFSNDPDDRGGPTNLGITETTLKRAQLLLLVPFSATIRTLTREQAQAVYRQLYWIAARCPEFPAPLDLLLFDGYVNHPPKSAVRFLQEALGVTEDGVVGEITLSAARLAAKKGELPFTLKAYKAARERFYRAIVANKPSQGKFLDGWLNRLEKLKSEALQDLAAA